ncbi:Retrovirus-related Pol polyprotein from transposon TNT 1-94-like protein 1 [Paraphaeosphaeria sporulosa]
MGLKPVEGIPCLFTNDKLIVFFYVDDIVVLFHPNNLAAHAEFEQKLRERYEIRCLGNLKWFLGIRVIRDEEQGKVWLLQDSFIDKVATKFNLRQKRYPPTPMDEEPLGPSDEEPVAARTEEYQMLVGSLAFISCVTRPDTAKPQSVLSKYLQNPSQKHLAAVKRVWKFLIGTQWHAICASATEKGVNNYLIGAEPTIAAGIEPLFYGASDASFADDPATRRSSYGYLFKLFGLPIDWKATVLRSVIKSTPETELMALSVLGVKWNGGSESSRRASLILS